MTKEELISNAKPILFNTDMVKVILRGQKTQTRRIMKPQPWCEIAPDCRCPGCIGRVEYDVCNKYDLEFPKAPYRIGDILYVRETWTVNNITPHNPEFLYKADYDCTIAPYSNWTWKPSVHMPKRAARIFLKITSVNVERLQEIDADSAKAEGANYHNGKHVGVAEKMRRTAVERFSDVWNTTLSRNDIATYGWDANPWVWIINFERMEVEA